MSETTPEALAAPTLTSDSSPDVVPVEQTATTTTRLEVPVTEDQDGAGIGDEPTPPFTGPADPFADPFADGERDEAEGTRDLTVAELAMMELKAAEEDLNLKRAGFEAAKQRYADAALEAEKHKRTPTLAECNANAAEQTAAAVKARAETTALLRGLVPGMDRGPRKVRPPIFPVGK